jgi:hypothetical protein
MDPAPAVRACPPTLMREANCGSGLVAWASEKPRFALAPTATPALVLPAVVGSAWPTAKLHLAFLAARSVALVAGPMSLSSWPQKKSAAELLRNSTAVLETFPLRESTAQKPSYLKESSAALNSG